ncbi:hypothetical protein L6R52_05410 [Myxococcota bacterium]|nr:hypothetical protein [Myxococcota bacterium]
MSRLDLTAPSRALLGDGVDAPEGALREILRAVDAGDLARAAERSAQLLRTGVSDVRPLVYFSFGLFLERGAQSIPAILGVLEETFGARWSVVRPTERKETTAATATSWLFRTIVQHLDFHARMDDDVHRTWRLLDASTLGGPALEAAERLRGVMSARLGASRALDMLSELEARVRTSFNRPAPARPAAPTLSVVPLPAEAEHDDEVPAAEDLAADVYVPTPRDVVASKPAVRSVSERPAPTEPARSVPAPEARATIEVTPAFEALMARLAAFTTLVERGDLARAAIVAADVQRTLSSFDPKIYFPRLLTPFFRLLSANIEALAREQGALGEDALGALEQLYAVDLEAFLEP